MPAVLPPEWDAMSAKEQLLWYLERLCAKAEELSSVLGIARVGDPPVVTSLVDPAASTTTHASSTTIPDVSCSTTKAHEVLEVIHKAAPDCITAAPVTCSTDCLNQVVAHASVNEVRDVATAIFPVPTVDLQPTLVPTVHDAKGLGPIPDDATPELASLEVRGAGHEVVAIDINVPTASAFTRSLVWPSSNSGTSETSLPSTQEVLELMPGLFDKPEAVAAADVKEHKDDAKLSVITFVLNSPPCYEHFSPRDPCFDPLDAQLVIEEHMRSELRLTWPPLVGNDFGELCSSGQFDSDRTLSLFPWNPGGYLLKHRNQMTMMLIIASSGSHWHVTGVSEESGVCFSPTAKIQWLFPICLKTMTQCLLVKPRRLQVFLVSSVKLQPWPSGKPPIFVSTGLTNSCRILSWYPRALDGAKRMELITQSILLISSEQFQLEIAWPLSLERNTPTVGPCCMHSFQFSFRENRPWLSTRIWEFSAISYATYVFEGKQIHTSMSWSPVQPVSNAKCSACTIIYSSLNWIMVTDLCNFSVMWYLDHGSLRIKQWWLDTQCLQLVNAIFAAFFWLERHIFGNSLQGLTTCSQFQLFLSGVASLFRMETGASSCLWETSDYLEKFACCCLIVPRDIPTLHQPIMQFMGNLYLSDVEGQSAICFVQSSCQLHAQNAEQMFIFSPKNVQPKLQYFACDYRAVRVWSELLRTELSDKFGNLSEHHILEHATVCSVPMSDKLERNIQLISLSVHRKKLSQEEFNGSVHFTRECYSDHHGDPSFLLAYWTVQHIMRLCFLSEPIPFEVNHGYYLKILRLLQFRLYN